MNEAPRYFALVDKTEIRYGSVDSNMRVDQAVAVRILLFIHFHLRSMFGGKVELLAPHWLINSI